MLKISRKASTTLSLVLSVLLMAILLAAVFCLPSIVNTLIELPDHLGDRTEMTTLERGLLLGICYGVLAVVAAADLLLFFLLRHIRAGEVFTDRCVALIRYLSWCLLLFGLLFLWIGWYFRLAYSVAFAGMFLGICLRVVKNAFEEAVIIKEENDFTV